MRKPLNAADIGNRIVTVTGRSMPLEKDSIKDLLSTLRRKGFRRLPITTPQGVLVGLVTLPASAIR
jgi:CBS domain-containing protein